jgi:hypothetical protein
MDSIPTNDVYKVHILDFNGNIKSVYVFCAKSFNEDHENELFSDTELALFQSQKVEVNYSEQLIHKDDSILTIKRKIMNEMEKGTISREEIYLFSYFDTEVDMNNIFHEATKNYMEDMSKEKFFQYATNLNVDPLDINRFDKESDSFEYNDWISLKSKESRFVLTKPVGMKFQEEYDYLFSANPYNIKSWSSNVRYEISPKNPIITFENSLLLNYGKVDSQNLYVCLASDVFEYAKAHEIDEEYLCEIYFPFLYLKKLTNSELLNAEKPQLAKDSITKQNVLQLYKNIDIFHQIYWNRTVDLPYIEKGVRKYSITFKAGNFKNHLPLDVLFKYLHATKTYPFIKYNPGQRRENMYRLYSEQISTNGKKIPILPEVLISKLQREIGKGHQISIYMKHSHKDKIYDIVFSIDTNSRIQVEGELSTPMSEEELKDLLESASNPVISVINGFLQSSGYLLKQFNLYEADGIKYVYSLLITIAKKITLSQQSVYISSAFDVLSSDVSQGARLRFKRVQNFIEMDAQSTLITELLGNGQDVLEGLISNYNISLDEAKVRYAKYVSEHQELNGVVIENPGFPVLFKMKPFKNELQVEISEIDSIDYISILHIYIDTILRITQDPTSTTVSEKIQNAFRSKAIKFDVKDKGAEVENMVVPTQSLIATKAQPLKFGQDKINVEDVAYGEDDSDEGFVYDDDDLDYEEDEEEEGEDEVPKGEFDGGMESEKPTDEDTNEHYRENIDGMSLKYPNIFQKTMNERDPKLFLTEKKGNFALYSRACLASDKRQPVILTDEEKKRIDETNPGSYEHAIKYGSEPDKQFWYICPRYWCLKTNSSITEEDVKAGKCGKVIPQNAEVVPKGAYVYEFANPKQHFDSKGNYKAHIPSFVTKAKHPDGLCMPCCFKKSWDSEHHVKLRQQCSQDISGQKHEHNPDDKKNIEYIKNPMAFPLDQYRWGYLQKALQLFLGTDNDAAMSKNNTAIIKPNMPCLLRNGIEYSEKQSFVGIISHFYAYKQELDKIPSIADTREIISDSMNLDLFLRYHNGSMVSTFRPKTIDQLDIDIDKYVDSEFYKSINISDDRQLDYLEDTIASYESFLEYLKNESSKIDHTYLWDIMSDRNPKLMRDGLNLVILEMANDDITNNIHLICPANSYSAISHDPNKETIIVFKDGDFYEPIHLFEARENGDVIVKKAFRENKAIQSIKDMLAIIELTKKKYCRPLPSMPRIYKFKQSITLQELIRLIKQMKTRHYNIVSQVLNFKGKVIGIRVNKEEKQAPLFIPCYPSSVVEDMKMEYMDDDSLWIDYRKTRDRLLGIHMETEGKIPCKPLMKIMDDNLIVGFLTETNQFVQINPPSQNIDDDGIEIMKHSNYAIQEKKNADIEITTNKEEDKTRIDSIRKINLEGQFYNVFRSKMRLLINDFENYKERQILIDLHDNTSVAYYNKIKRIDKMLIELAESSIIFQEFDDETLEEFQDIISCNQDPDGKCSANEEGESKKYCLTTSNGVCQTIFPKKNLISGHDNEKVYFGRLADEILRYRRIRSFMLYPKTHLNISNIEYKINETELFLLESVLNKKEYFRDLIPYNSNKYIQNISYDAANPAISQKYSSDVSTEEQKQLLNVMNATEGETSNFILDCIRETKPRVIGNDRAGSWRPFFPITMKEIVFGSSLACSFIPMIYILQDFLKNKSISEQSVKTTLWKGYSNHFAVFKDKIIALLKRQGKKEFTKMLSKGTTLESIIMSDSYYITDLDWWMLCSVIKLPLILFSSTSLKYLSNTVSWLRLGSSGKPDEKYYFVRSPLEYVVNTPSSYHLLSEAIALSDLKGGVFSDAVRGDVKYIENMQTLDNFLQKYHIIVKKK